MAQKEVESLWRKKLVLQSMRVDVFMGYSENPMPPPSGGQGDGISPASCSSRWPDGQANSRCVDSVFSEGVERNWQTMRMVA